MGLFELAHKGTLFMDEIGELPLSMQASLLRVLQEKEIRRLGDDKIIPIDVRVIAATNVNIQEKARTGEFRGGPLLPSGCAAPAGSAPAQPAGGSGGSGAVSHPGLRV